MQRSRIVPALSIIALTAAAAFTSAAWAAPPERGERVLDARVEQQIAELVAEKRARTAEQKKISPQLLYAAKMAKGLPITASVATLETGVDLGDAAGPEVEIRANVTPRTLDLVRKLGGSVIRSHAFAKSIRAKVPLDQLENLAADPDVLFVLQPPKPATNRMNLPLPKRQPGQAPPRPGPSFAKAVVDEPSPSVDAPATPPLATRQAAVRARVQQAMATAGIQPLVGAATSEGDVTHRANLARSTYGFNGAGIKIGVLSDSFDAAGGYAQDILTGDLPGPGNPNGYTTPVHIVGSGDYSGGADEGRAMLQIIHDLAPGAELYFATAFNGIEDFAANIYALRDAGCQIIVDDVFYYVESALHAGQNGVTSELNMAIVTQAVNDVTKGGTLYFSSAGNQGNKLYNTASAWEGDFSDAGYSAVVDGWVLDFDKGPGVQGYNTVVWGLSFQPIYILQWADPLGASVNDFDLFLVDPAGTTVVAASTGVQDGSQDPLEGFSLSGYADNYRLVVTAFSTVQTGLFLNLSGFGDYLQFTTGGQTRGHATALNGFGVAAAPASLTFPPDPPGIPGNDGPYPGVFSPASDLEWFTSDGYRRVFFDEFGAAITPGNFSERLSGGDVFLKPDITAADGTMTTVPPYFMPFYGTSAAAPHAAAIAALVKAAKPSLTVGQVRGILTGTAIDIETPGPDPASGYGIVDAFAAVAATGVSPAAVLTRGTVVVTEVGGNGNGVVEPGESGTISVQLVNSGAVNATAITSVLSSVAGVTITAANSAYPNIAASGGTATNTTLFAYTLSPSYPCGQPVPFTLTVSFTGGQTSPVAFGLTAATAAPSPAIAGSMSGTAPAPGTLYTTRAFTSTTRLFRDGVPSTCAGKAYPGTSGSGARRSHVYVFKNASASATCVTVNVTTLPTALHVIGYVGLFNPASFSQGYAGDIGSSAPGTFSFNVPGSSYFSVVVIENSGVSSAAYGFSLSGVCLAPVPAAYGALASDGYTITTDQCPAGGDSVASPGEQVTASFSLRNTGAVATVNLVATPASVLVTSPSPAALTYGAVAAGATAAQPLTFTVAPQAWVACGTSVPVDFVLTDGATSLGTVTFSFQVGGYSAVPSASESFDGVTAPALPAGWATAATSGAAWTTSTTASDTPLNNATAPSDVNLSDKTLTSAAISIPAGGAQVAFRNNYSLESGFDGGVLEISIAGGSFQDILAAGGTFVSGGYTHTISTVFSSPIAGRQAWSGSSAGYLTTRVKLPASANGKSIQLRWRLATDSSVLSGPWRIDTLGVFPAICGGPVTYLDRTPNATICTGSTHVLGALFRGTGPISTQWRKGGVPVVPDGVHLVLTEVPSPGIPDGFATFLTINSANGGDAGSYDAVATGACGAPVTSPAILLNVQTSAYSASITSSSSLCTGQTASASVTTSAPSPTYFWSVTGFTGQAEIVGPTNGSSVVVRGTAPGKVVLEATITPSGGGCKVTATKEITVTGTPFTPVITAPASASAGATGLVASVPSNAGSTYAWTVTNGTITDGQGTASITFTAGTGGTMTLSVTETSASCGAATASVTIPVSGAGGPCVADGTTLCLNLQRFEVKVAWKKLDGTTGSGQAVPFAPAPPDSGYFWFFDAANLELIVKVLDGRGVNGMFWVMYGALSDVEYTITVRDTETGNVKTYQNAQGTMASVADVMAFPDSSRSLVAEAWSKSVKEQVGLQPISFSELLAATLPPAPKAPVETGALVASLGACAANATTLCLNGGTGRFQVTVDWDVSIPIGTYGPGRAVPVTADTGCFWFFNDRNIELAVKVLDGTLVNGHYWVFYGALSDVHYVLRVTDTVTGAVKTYENPKGTLASMGDTTAFLP